MRHDAVQVVKYAFKRRTRRHPHFLSRPLGTKRHNKRHWCTTQFVQNYCPSAESGGGYIPSGDRLGKKVRAADAGSVELVLTICKNTAADYAPTPDYRRNEI